uniref:hypothetical protein n=1 Tax=Okeania sp. SIO2F4 TaxID=2607790 RepID=UPI0025D837C4
MTIHPYILTVIKEDCYINKDLRKFLVDIPEFYLMLAEDPRSLSTPFCSPPFKAIHYKQNF